MVSNSISVIIPSISAPTLRRTLDSIVHQGLILGDQVLVIGDHYQPMARDLVLEYRKKTGGAFEYYQYEGESCWGNPNRNFAFQYCTGRYISFMDEDDIYTEGAFTAIRSNAGIHPDKLFMYRFKHQVGGILWHTPGFVVGGSVGGHCIVPPNIAEKLGRWSMNYCGDFDFIKSTMELWDQSDLFWVDSVIAICRPTEQEVWFETS